MIMSAGVPMLVFWGPELVQLFNDAFQPSLGEPPAHIAALGARGAEYWAEVWEQRGPQIRHILDGGTSKQHADVLIPMTRNGKFENVWWTFTDMPLFGDNGLIAGVLVLCQETTERMRTQEHQQVLLAELAAERTRLQRLIERMPAPVALHSGPEHRFEIVSNSFRMVSGGRDLTGMTPQEAYPEVIGQGILERFDDVARTGNAWISNETHARFDRRGLGVEDTWFDIRYEPVLDGDGKVVGILNFSFDVTDQVLARQQVERLLSESEAVRDRLEAVLGSFADAFYLLDRQWRFTHVNAAAEPLLQTTADKLIGRTLWEMFPGVIGSVFEVPYREAMERGHVTSAEAYFDPLGTYFDVRTYPWSGGLMVHFRDIGERKSAEAEREQLLRVAQAARADAETARIQTEVANTQLQEQALELEMQAEELQMASVQLEERTLELEQRSAELEIEAASAEIAREEAVAANRAKSEFLTIMSHELRTPLNAIDGYAELMELGIRGPLTDEQRHDLARIRKSEKHLLGLINGVLNYAQVEAGAVHYELTQVKVDEVLATCEALVAPQANNKALALRRWPCDPALTVRADREKLQQIVLNLLSNSIKFTNPGGYIEIRCGAQAVERGGQVLVQVSDTGIGIAAGQLTRIFEPFVQVDSEFTRTREGTGLGLAISRDLARGMGGELTADSALGHGSTFTLSLRAE